MSEYVNCEIPQTVTVTDLSKLLGMSVGHVRDRLVHQPGFPRPVHWIQKPKRWKLDEVKKWIRS